MGASKGNTNAKGNKGGGRKSAYQERADADLLWNVFNNPVNKAELAKRIATGTCTIRDVWVLKALSGNERLIDTIVKKLFPDSVNFTANMNQKQMEEIEDNVRDLLDLAGKYTRKEQRMVQGNRESIEKSVEEAVRSIGSKGKVKAKVKVKRT